MKKIIMVDPNDFFTGRSKRDMIPMDDLKVYKKWKKFLKKEEEEKNKAKKGPEGWWARKSVAERTCIIAIFGPPAGIAYVFGLLQIAKLLAISAGVH